MTTEVPLTRDGLIRALGAAGQLANSVLGVPDQHRFGRLVANRRRELGMSQRDVRDVGGPSDYTVRKLENGETDRPDFSTLAKLDAALQWTPGSASRTFEGGFPERLDGNADPASAAHSAPVMIPEDTVNLRMDVLADLVEKAKPVDEIAARINDPELQLAVDALGIVVDRVYRAWFIRQLEQFKAHGLLSARKALIDLMFGDYLARAPIAEDPLDAEELAYIRWLVGRFDHLSDEQIARFESRWQT